MPRLAFAAALLIAAGVHATPLVAQADFALKAHYLYNGSAARDAGGELPSADGFSVGAEVRLPLGIGLGVSGYAAGDPTDFGAESSSLGALVEASYFFAIPLLPVSPYLGVHGGVGTVGRDGFAGEPSLADHTARQLGVQAGVRLQLAQRFGVDAQVRRVSLSASELQDEGLERTQLLLGVVLF